MGLLLTYSFFIGAARIFTRSAAMGLFLAEFDAGALPYAYMGMAITITLISIAYLRLGQRVSLSRLLLVTLIFLLVGSVSVWAGLNASHARRLLFSLPIWYETLWTLTNLAFWNLAGRILNVRQGKRLFGVVSSGEPVAILLGGLLVPVLVGFIGTDGLFLVVGGMLLAAIAMLVIIRHTFDAQLNVPLEHAAAKAPESAAGVLKNKYVLLLCHLFGLTITSFFVVDAIFYSQAEVRYPDETTLAGFVGVFFGVVASISLLSRLVGSGWLIRRFGIRTTALLEPIIVGFGLLLVTLALNLPPLVALVFWLMAGTKIFNQVFIQSTMPIMFNIFYQPLPPLRRTQVQTLVEGIIYPLAIGIAGGGLALLTGVLNFGVTGLIYVALGLIALRIVTSIWTTRVYPGAMQQALVKRKISGEGLRLDDDASRAVLLQSLHHPQPAVALHAMSMLAQSDPAALTDNIPVLLRHPAPEVRLSTLRVIEQEKLTPEIPALAACLPAEPNAAVRASLLRTLAGLGQTEAIEQIYPALDDPDRQIQAEAIVSLLRYTGIEVAMMAEGKLLSLSMSDDVADRITAAKILGRVSGRNLGQLFTSLLDDPAVEVRRAALQAAGTGNHPRVWPAVISQLRQPGLRSATAAALTAGGQQALPDIIAAFEQAAQPPDVLQRLARACGRIGGPQATAFLLGQLDHPHGEVRTQILEGLHRCGYRPDEAGRIAIQRQLAVETDGAVEILARQVDFECGLAGQSVSAGVLLQAGLAQQLDQARGRMFWLLSFIYPCDTILQARDNLALAAADKKAYALEVLELTLPTDVKTRLFPLLEELSPQQRLAQLAPSTPGQGIDYHLQALIGASDGQVSDWERACAIYAAHQLKMITPPLAAQIRALSQPGAAVPMAEATQIALTGEIPMLSTIEKVLILKTVNLFDGTPDEILAEVAALLAEVELLDGTTVFQKGDAGDCMYVIVNGRVKVHDGDTIFNTLGEGDVFGEMALLDPEPRVASITALDDTRLLRLDREPFFELMEDYIEVTRGVIHVLSGHLRNRVRDVAELKAQVKQLRAQLNLPDTP